MDHVVVTQPLLIALKSVQGLRFCRVGFTAVGLQKWLKELLG